MRIHLAIVIYWFGRKLEESPVQRKVCGKLARKVWRIADRAAEKAVRAAEEGVAIAN